MTLQRLGLPARRGTHLHHLADMTANASLVIGSLGAATITGIASIFVALLRTRGELRNDHAQVQQTLDRIDNRTERLEDRIDDHLQWHAEQD